MEKHILMVCLGNICRSPLAEGILQSKLKNDKFIVDSAGTSSHHQGEKPDSRSVAIGQRFGIDITEQRSRPFQVSDFDIFDYILVMDKSNYNNIIKLAKNETQISKVKLIMEYSNDTSEIEVPDPYYGGDHGFENIYHMINKACDDFIKSEKLC